MNRVEIKRESSKKIERFNMHWEMVFNENGNSFTRRLSDYFSPTENVVDEEVYENLNVIPSQRVGTGAELINGANIIASRSHMHRLNQVQM